MVFTRSFRGAHITLDQSEFNKSMSKVRISVEMLFGNGVENFLTTKILKRLG